MNATEIQTNHSPDRRLACSKIKGPQIPGNSRKKQAHIFRVIAAVLFWWDIIVGASAGSDN